MGQLQPALTRRPRILLALLSAFAAILLINGCDRAEEKGSLGSRFVEVRVDTITVTDTIVVVDTVFVEKEIVKRVEVPAEIPAHYERAWQRLVAESSAAFADEKTCFSGLNSMKVSIVMTEDAKDILSERRAKDKLELTLRRHGVPLSDLSNPYLRLAVEVLWNEAKTIAIFDIAVELRERLVFYRNHKPYERIVTLWEVVKYGHVGKNFAKEYLLELIEEKAERVANLYLSAN